jgi:hypothetical protein
MADELPVKVDIGASIKLEATTEIPSETSGRAVNALVDAVSPFTELLGLAGDHIRAIRQQRAIDRANAARKQLESHGKTIGKVPDGFLLPWIEKTSQDEAEDGLEKTWSNLLSSAADSYMAKMKVFPDILSQLSAAEVRFLDEICHPVEYSETRVLHTMNEHLHKIDRGISKDGQYIINGPLIDTALNDESDAFVRIKSIEIGTTGEGSRFNTSPSYRALGSGCYVLERAGLIELISKEYTQGRHRIEATYIVLTRLGLEFVNAARGLDGEMI